ncbi:TerB family tellurite resistance protein [Sporolactobacillus terrae]|uniref:TerB family tellurite resistance protein n=1 Tax=Sporolactobacillus terrae TaxID=269673 RepID=UPI00111A4731|nr:TerB family tellurite resistance protein [Sporolactobacillus terrae]
MTWRILFGIACALFASTKRRNVVLWFIAGFFFEVFALIILFFLPRTIRQSGSSRRSAAGRRGPSMQWTRKVTHTCPYCGSSVVIDDIPGRWTCQNCGQTFTYGTDGQTHQADEETLMPQVEWIVKLFAKLAKQDGVVSENEVRQVDLIVRQAFQPSRQQRRKIMTIFNESRYSDESFESIAQNLYDSLGGRRDVLVDTVTALLAIAVADGALRPEEDAMISTAAGIFGLARHYEVIKAQFFGQSSGSRTSNKTSLEEGYRLLGCTSSDSDQVIKKKYRQLIKDNHPDRLMSQGASEADIKAANEKVAQIKRAYEQIMAARS